MSATGSLPKRLAKLCARIELKVQGVIALAVNMQGVFVGGEKGSDVLHTTQPRLWKRIASAPR